MSKNKDLFGQKVKEIYFIGVPAAEDGGFTMCSCGRSNKDNGPIWVVTTTGLHADEIPDECSDAEEFSKLVAKLLNEYYNRD